MGMFNKNPNNQDNQKNSNLLFKLILIILLIIIIILLLLRSCDAPQEGPVLEPDFELVEQDQQAQTIPGETEPAEKPQVEQGGGSMTLIYSDQVSVNLATGKVGLFYQNPSDSSHSIVVQILITRGEEKYLVAQSGGIAPGYMVTELTMEEDLKLSAGIYEGLIRLLFFDPDTGERAVVDTNIPADITVK